MVPAVAADEGVHVALVHVRPSPQDVLHRLQRRRLERLFLGGEDPLALLVRVVAEEDREPRGVHILRHSHQGRVTEEPCILRNVRHRLQDRGPGATVSRAH